jgi:CubicO group peptidase (beta-lactamase class C family)
MLMTDPHDDEMTNDPGRLGASNALSRVRPAEVGVDLRPLLDMSEWIQKQDLDVRSFLVVKDRQLVFEHYGNGVNCDCNHNVYSVTNTVTALLFGILVEEGKISPEDKLAAWLAKDHPELASALADKQDIELGHLLSMSSGLFYNFAWAGDPLFCSPDSRLRIALTAVAKAASGTTFNYTVISPVLVGAVVNAAAGVREDQFAEGRIFRPLQMENYDWAEADKTGAVSGGSGLWLRAMDMAKLGLMMLDGGQWQGMQIVPGSWIRQMSKPSPAAKDYGYFCWINHIVETEPEFGAMGFGGQFITVLPQSNAVVVMTSNLAGSGGVRDAGFLQLYRRMVNEHVLPALRGGSLGRVG